MPPSVMWFRRDLRMADNPALNAAAVAGDVVPLILIDPYFETAVGKPWMAFYFGCMRAMNEDMGGSLVVRVGKPQDVVPAVAKEAEATQVFVTEDFTPYGIERDATVEAELAKLDVTFERVDSPYAVEPGEVRKGDGTPYAVFTPFSRAWSAHGWGSPHPAASKITWLALPSDGIPDDPKKHAEIIEPGEAAAHKRLTDFLDEDADNYNTQRDDPGKATTSRLSAYLRFGNIHPRQVLAKLGNSQAHSTFRNELCWREFYADVLFHNPASRVESLQPQMKGMQLDTGKLADERFDAWSQGMTGYPIVDAGMRQLLGEAFMHNRVRMIVASFLIKDLHIDWTRGAQWFLDHLVDGDPASNTHGWQWVAGTGTDASPYFRVFNPTTQAKKFDPDGVYVKRWVPELRDVDPKLIHEPWKAKDLFNANSYPDPIVDHAVEREEALKRYATTRG